MRVSPPRGDIPPWPLIPGEGAGERGHDVSLCGRCGLTHIGYGSKRDVDSFPNLALHAFVGCDKRGRATGEGRASWSWVITRER